MDTRGRNTAERRVPGGPGNRGGSVSASRSGGNQAERCRRRSPSAGTKRVLHTFTRVRRIDTCLGYSTTPILPIPIPALLEKQLQVFKDASISAHIGRPSDFGTAGRHRPDRPARQVGKTTLVHGIADQSNAPYLDPESCSGKTKLSNPVLSPPPVWGSARGSRRDPPHTAAYR